MSVGYKTILSYSTIQSDSTTNKSYALIPISPVFYYSRII